MTIDPKVQRIITWRESFATLPDNHFFELVRMYLGEIKTPYNKQKLIEELGTFIRKDENKQNLIALLDKDDLELISAVKFIPLATQENLALFFSGVYSYAALYERIVNLEERLVIYQYENKVSGKILVGINPLLEESLEPLLTIDRLIPQTVFSEKNEALPFTLNSQFIASFISFAFSHPEMCKADGTFKKRTVTELQEVYEGTETKETAGNRLQLLSTAFCNLNIFHANDDGIQVDGQRLSLFAELPPSMQYVYICVASSDHLSRTSMELNAQLLLNVLASVPKEGYSRIALTRLVFIAQQKIGVQNSEFAQSRISLLANRTLGERHDGGLMECLIDSCVAFGILYVLGKNQLGEDVYGVSPLFTEQSAVLPGEPKVLSIDAGFSVTIMPGLSLAQILSLVIFMDTVRYDTAAVFEITKRSVMRSFDSGYTPKKIFALLQKYNAYEISQNLSVSVEEWYHSYSSASLYKGYVLKVSDEKCMLVENNPVLSPYIKQTLASGIYLLSVSSDEEAKVVFQKSGLDFMGNIKTGIVENEALGFSKLQPRCIDICSGQQNGGALVQKKCDETEKNKLISRLSAELKKMDLTAEQKECLSDRIERKIIVNPIQLRGTSVRFERLEAGGMDYSGKIHVVDNAITNGNLIEIECSGGNEILVGMPLSLNKKSDNAEVTVRLEPDQSIMTISIGAANRIKKLRGTPRH